MKNSIIESTFMSLSIACLTVAAIVAAQIMTGCTTIQEKWTQDQRIVLMCKETPEYGGVTCIQVFEDDFQDTLNGNPAKVGLPKAPSKSELDGDKPVDAGVE